MSGAASIRGWARDVERFAERWPAEGARVVDEAISARLRADTGGDGALGRGRDLGRASTTVTVRRGAAEVVAAGSHRVWAILQSGTRPHVVKAAPGRMLRTPHGPRRSVRVGGSRARETFTEGAAEGLDRAAEDAADAWARVGG